MKSLGEYASLNAAAVRQHRQQARLARARKARAIVKAYWNDTYSPGQSMTKHEKKLAKAIEEALAEEAGR